MIVQVLAIVVPVILALLGTTAWLSAQIATLRATMVTRDACETRRTNCPARIELGIEHSQVHAVDSRGCG